MKYILISFLLITSCSFHHPSDYQAKMENYQSETEKQKQLLIERSFPITTIFSCANKMVYLHSKNNLITENIPDSLHLLIKAKTEEFTNSEYPIANCFLIRDSLYVIMANSHNPALLFDSLNIIYTSYLGKYTFLWTDNSIENSLDFHNFFKEDDIAFINASLLPVIQAIYLNHELSFIMTDYG